MAFAELPDELRRTGLAIVARTRGPLMRVGNPDRSSGISARSIQELDSDTPRPTGLDGTTVGNA
jgi:hypothetical protein